jgi:hypothetical protein
MSDQQQSGKSPIKLSRTGQLIVTLVGGAVPILVALLWRHLTEGWQLALEAAVILPFGLIALIAITRDFIRKRLQ